MNQNTEDKNEIRNLRIFAALVFVVMISGAVIVAKCNRTSDYKNMNKLEFFIKQ